MCLAHKVTGAPATTTPRARTGTEPRPLARLEEAMGLSQAPAESQPVAVEKAEDTLTRPTPTNVSLLSCL